MENCLGSGLRGRTHDTWRLNEHPQVVVAKKLPENVDLETTKCEGSPTWGTNQPSSAPVSYPFARSALRIALDLSRAASDRDVMLCSFCHPSWSAKHCGMFGRSTTNKPLTNQSTSNQPVSINQAATKQQSTSNQPATNHCPSVGTSTTPLDAPAPLIEGKLKPHSWEWHATQQPEGCHKRLQKKPSTQNWWWMMTDYG